MHRVALLEPDQWRRLGIAAVLSESGSVVAEDRAVDLVLVSCRYLANPGMSEVARVRARFDAEVVVLDDEHSIENAARAFAAGARGYFDLAGDPSMLAQAVEVVSEGGIWGPREALVMMSRAAAPEDADDELEPQQREVLRLLHEGMTNKEIGHRLGVAEGTVKARMNRLYRRFGVASRVQLLAAAFKKGLF